MNASENAVTVTRSNGDSVTYDPRRLRGVTLYREEERTLAVGDRVQFNAPFRARRVVNGVLGTLAQID